MLFGFAFFINQGPNQPGKDEDSFKGRGMSSSDLNKIIQQKRTLESTIFSCQSIFPVPLFAASLPTLCTPRE